MNESQKAFEAHYKANHHFWHSSIFAAENDGCYAEIFMRDHFQNWQAAEAYGRKQALEDVANGFIKQKSWTQDMAHAVVQHAADEGAKK
jgi:hypothetical protein